MGLSYEQLRDKLLIDPVLIDQHLIELPSLVQEAAEMAANAHDMERQAKHNLEQVQTEAAGRLRDAVPEGQKAPSEASIHRQLPNEPDVVEAREIYNQVLLRSERSSALVGSLREKSRLIGKLADLIIAGYVTPSSISRNPRIPLRR